MFSKEEIHALVLKNFPKNGSVNREYSELLQMARFSDLSSIVAQNIFVRTGKIKKKSNL